ncbi:MAG: 3'-5' exonuclease [Lachnospiraceae bacterium]|nr:3'-5' exonuclease [Lachnospiraceae bacterium]
MVTDFVSLDLETTGLNPKEDAIIEIGAVRFRDGKEDKVFQTLLNPGRIIPQRITELTGIAQKDIEEMPHFADIQKELLAFLGDDILMAHSVLFDYSFLKRAVVNNGGVSNKGSDTFEKQGIDTLKIARKFLPDLESRRLSFLCDRYNIPIKAHRAVEDARATGILYTKLAEEFLKDKPENAKDFMPVLLKYKVKKEGPATPAQKERLYKLLDKHKLKTEYDIGQLTKNEASRYLDRIYAEYGR